MGNSTHKTQPQGAAAPVSQTIQPRLLKCILSRFARARALPRAVTCILPCRFQRCQRFPWRGGGKRVGDGDSLQRRPPALSLFGVCRATLNKDIHDGSAKAAQCMGRFPLCAAAPHLKRGASGNRPRQKRTAQRPALEADPQAVCAVHGRWGCFFGAGFALSLARPTGGGAANCTWNALQHPLRRTGMSAEPGRRGDWSYFPSRMPLVNG